MTKFSKQQIEELKVQAELFSEQIKILADTKDPILRAALVNKIEYEWKPHLGFTKKDINYFAIIVNAPEPELDVKKSYNLLELLDSETPDADWIVPELIRAGGGLYILGAAPKVGKSYLLYDLAASMAVKGQFIDRPCKKGRVLYYCLEEPHYLVKKRIIGAGLDPDLGAEVQKAVEENRVRIIREFDIGTDLGELSREIDEFKPDIVFFDSFRAATSAMDISENSSDASKAVYALQKLLIVKGVTGIMIHHMNKSADPDSGSKGLSGSLSIVGASDGSIMIYPDKQPEEEGQHALILRTEPREGVLLHWRIARKAESDGHHWSFRLVEEKSIDPAIVENRPRILRVLGKAALANSTEDSKFTKAELAYELGVDPMSSSLGRTLEMLVDAQVISCQRNKQSNQYQYWINVESPWAEFLLLTGKQDGLNPRPLLTKEALDADALIKCTDKQDIKDILSEWGREYTERIYKILTKEEKDKINNILYPRKFEVGQWIHLQGDVEEGAIYQIESYRFVNDEESKQGTWKYKITGKEENVIESELQPSLDYAPTNVTSSEEFDF